jgi:hypothetical protein
MRTDRAAAPASLETALDALRARGLELRRGGEPRPTRSRPAIPTGHAALDEALGTRGWPRGALASLEATPGSGATSLALGSAAACQRTGGLVAWLDLPGVFDPATASRIGVDLAWLLVARPQDPDEAVELAAWLARGGLIDALVLDLGADPPPGRTAASPRPAAIARLASLLARGECVGLVLGGSPAVGAAGVRVTLERVAWLAVGRDLVGQRVTATVARQRWGIAGRGAELDLWFAEGRRIDPWLARAACPVRAVPSVERDEREEREQRPALQVVGA